MKNISILIDKVIIRHKESEYSFPRINGALDIPPEKIGKIPEVLALLLILLSGAKRLYLAKETYFALRNGIWFHLDLQKGGLKELAKELFEDDEDVIQAGELHRKSFQKRPPKSTAKE